MTESDEVRTKLEPEVESINNDFQSHSTRDDNVQNTIFVGNLPNKTTSKDVKKLFGIFGPILHARLRGAVRKELKIPKKLAIIKKEFHEDNNHINAYIKFKNVESCKSALIMNGELYENHHLRVTLAEDEGKTDPKKSIFVGNLVFKIHDDDLWQAFEDCGPIDRIRVIRDQKTGIGKGFGYVNFKSADAVELALKLDGIPILGRNVRVSRVTNDGRANSSVKRKKLKKILSNDEPKQKGVKVEKQSKPFRTKVKHEFQGQKTKASIQKKPKKKKRFDKKKMVIKQIAEQMSKKK
uniref:RRM domain-containing protein n=1 Tax=Homalodisca liturata TaxID=320908 RepID=A0A1B6K3G8_9HEMI